MELSLYVIHAFVIVLHGLNIFIYNVVYLINVQHDMVIVRMAVHCFLAGF